MFSRDYVFVDDVVNGIVAAMNYPRLSCDRVFNLGGGKLVSMETVVHILETELNKKAEIVRDYQLSAATIRHLFLHIEI